jgi:cytochrome c-type biogenesis protein CcmH
MKKLLPILALILLLASFLPDAALAQGTTPSDDEVNAIARQLYCPVCENTPLDVCPTEACKQWRELIRLKLSEGWTEDQIKQYFVEQYGARVLAEPPRQGFSWMLYIGLALLFGAGVYIAYGAFRSMRASQVEDVAAPIQASEGDDYLKRVEEELKKRN